MENINEDAVVEETTNEEFVPETTVEPETVETETEVENIEPDTTDTVEEDVSTEDTTETEIEDDLTDDDFADIENMLFGEDESEEDESEEEPIEDEDEITQPKFFKEDNEELSEEDLAELDETITALEEENNSFKEKIGTYEQEVNDLSSALDKIGEHPVLGPLATALLEGKELNIPDILKEKVKEEISSLPGESVSNEGIEVEKELNPLEKIAMQGQGQANFLKGL